MKDDPAEPGNLALERPETTDELELKMGRWLRRKLGKQLDPLESIVSHGLPVHDWVERSAERRGMLKRYEEWRMLVDRAETPQLSWTFVPSVFGL